MEILPRSLTSVPPEPDFARIQKQAAQSFSLQVLRQRTSGQYKNLSSFGVGWGGRVITEGASLSSFISAKMKSCSWCVWSSWSFLFRDEMSPHTEPRPGAGDSRGENGPSLTSMGPTTPQSPLRPQLGGCSYVPSPRLPSGLAALLWAGPPKEGDSGALLTEAPRVASMAEQALF